MRGDGLTSFRKRSTSRSMELWSKEREERMRGGGRGRRRKEGARGVIATPSACLFQFVLGVLDRALDVADVDFAIGGLVERGQEEFHEHVQVGLVLAEALIGACANHFFEHGEVGIVCATANAEARGGTHTHT